MANLLRSFSKTRVSTRNGVQCRLMHASAPALAPPRRQRVQELLSEQEALEHLDKTYADDDTTSLGHIMLRQQRHILKYLRLIEHDMPHLVALRKPFVPPDNSKPLIVRQVDYAGEEMPVIVKRVIVAPVSQLPLQNEAAVHKFKLIAGNHWTPHPPKDGGVGDLETWQEGYVKISCERFPEPAMNLKWASDTLDRLVKEANTSPEAMADIPIDLRHVQAKAKKDKKGEHLRGRLHARPTIRDFPKEWLPDAVPSDSAQSSPLS